jgi:hypothetical protein
MDELERQQFFAALDRRFEELRAEPQAWAEIEDERALEAAVLRDASH